jgi:hypothetical protein
MTDDPLTEFRSGVALPTDETARRIYARAVGVRRRTPRRRLALGVAIAALVLVPTAVALRGQIADLFEGTPPPPAVSTSFTQSNELADSAIQQGFVRAWPHADVAKVHGVIEIPTADGPEDLWAAPNDQGGVSYIIDFANDPRTDHGMESFGGHTTATPPSNSKIDISDVWTQSHPDLLTVYGSVDADAATVRITFDDGSSMDLPVVEHLFLGSAPKGVKLETATAFDAAGNPVAQHALRPASKRG